ncbi:MAG: PHP domain-containing protein [Actinomycetota bacterium]|nr:PHP domain-containing protein [Actinomycetota bacterium]
MRADLHVHSTFSDGTTTPVRNAELAAAAGLEAVALTDHDTTSGWAESATACAAYGLEFVPGIELSTELDGRSVHLLGYWVDPAHERLSTECARLRDARMRRARRMIERLSALGIELSMATVEAYAQGAPIGRPHVAASLVAAGVVPDAQAAFDRYLGEDGPAYVVKHAADPVDGVGLLVAAGGAAVLAHPGSTWGEHPRGLSGTVGSVSDARRDRGLDLLDRLAAAGLAGVEVEHPAHDLATTLRWRRAAARRGLLVTGASDFHGEGRDVKIGERTTSTWVLAALRERAADGASARGGAGW